MLCFSKWEKKQHNNTICKIENIYVFPPGSGAFDRSSLGYVATQLKEENMWLVGETHFFMFCLPVWKEKAVAG